MKARVTKYSKLMPDSIGWFTAAEFADISANRVQVSQQIPDMSKVDTYVQLFRQLQVKMLTAPVTMTELYNVYDSVHHFTVMTFANEADLNTMFNFLRSDGTLFNDFMQARDALASMLGVSISTYRDVDLSAFSLQFQPTVDQLVAVTSQLVSSAD